MHAIIIKVEDFFADFNASYAVIFSLNKRKFYELYTNTATSKKHALQYNAASYN